METDAIVEQYKALRKSGSLAAMLLVEYRCAKGCLLLHAWNSSAGALYYRPQLTVSKQMQFRTGTADVGRMPETGGELALLDSAAVVWGDATNSVLIGCPHCIGIHFPAASLKADAAAAKPGAPVKVGDFWMSPSPPE